MKIHFVALLFIIAGLAGCSSKNALKLNDTIVKANDNLRIESDFFGKKFQGVTDYNYTVLEPERQRMISLIDQKLQEVAAVKSDMPGGDDFKKAFIDYYNFEKDIYSTDYKVICQITGEQEADKLLGIAELLKQKAIKEASMENNIHVEQDKFAKKNNLKLK